MKIKINSLADLKHIVYAFIITAVVGIALKGGAAWSNIACALTGAATAEISKNFELDKKRFGLNI